MNSRKAPLVVIAIVVAVGLAALVIFIRHVPEFSYTPHLAESYIEAMQRFSELQKQEAELPLCPEGRSRIFTHGRKTERVIVLLHGLTNCPEQFVPLARILFASGANVIVPRARYAGFADRMNADQGRQSAQDLINQAADGVDVASGLGNRITVVGLSGSGVAAMWMAQNGSGLDQVVILAPFFSLHGHSVFGIDLISVALKGAPNFYKWWDDQAKEALAGPVYAYPRYGSVCMAETVQLSRNVRHHIESRPLRIARLDIRTTGSPKSSQKLGPFKGPEAYPFTSFPNPMEFLMT